MGKFSGILLCTDFDGTLAVSARVVEKNKAAIEYFKENGGLFTVITGRGVPFVEERLDEIGCNTYVGCVNGSVIYHLSSGTVISENFMTGDIVERLKKVKIRISNFKDIMVFRQTETICIRSTDQDFDALLEEAFCAPVYKFLIHSIEPFTEDEIVEIKHIIGDGYELSRSWALGIEGQNAGMNKGQAARRIAELVGARLLVCVGDYENDISMIKQADIGYAVGNAMPLLKEIADRITVEAGDGAIAAVISDLEEQVCM
jgi:HAD superfamily hydrolase (TIGR01484 family)